MSKDKVVVTVAEYAESPDIGVITYGTDMSVSVSKTDNGTFIVNIENLSEKRLLVDVMIEGDEPIWEGVLEA